MTRQLAAVLTALTLFSSSLASAEPVATAAEGRALKRTGLGLLIGGGAALQAGAMAIGLAFMLRTGEDVGDSVIGAFNSQRPPERQLDGAFTGLVIGGTAVAALGAALMIGGAIKLVEGRSMTLMMVPTDGGISAGLSLGF